MGRRRSEVDAVVEVGGALLDWCRRPHWTWKLRAAAFVAAVCFAWWWLNSLKWGCVAVTSVVAHLRRPGGRFVAVTSVVAIYAAQRAIRWGVERHRLTLEAGLPPNPVQMVKHYLSERDRFAQIESRWEKLCAAQATLRLAGQAPRLHRLRLTLAGDPEAYVDMGSLGSDLEPLMKLAPSVMPAAMGCTEVTIRPGKKIGTAWITFCKSSPLARPFGIAELPPSGPTLISAGITDTGAVAAMEYGLSVLAGGATGSGKSSWLWSVFADLRRDNIPVELFIVDPKRVELARFAKKVGESIGNIRIAGYVTTEADAKTMFAGFVEGMHERQDRLAESGLRKIDTPTGDFPARIIVIDEMMDIVGAFSGKSSPLGIAISQGRATKDWVIGLTQQAKLSTLGADLRDLFPLRRGFRTATPENTKAIMTLGETDGVACSRIPRSLPGVGYAVDEDGSVVKFRTAYVSDEDADRLAEGLLPQGMLTANDMRGVQTWVYVAWLGTRCQYVGVATSVS